MLVYWTLPVSKKEREGERDCDDEELSEKERWKGKRREGKRVK